MTLHIREATSDDIAAMHAIRMAVRENRLSDPGWLTPAVYRACLADAGSANTWVCETEHGIAGFATGRVVQQDIWALFVDPAQEGRGIGKALLAAATEWLFARGVAAIELSTTPDTRADRFYRQAGWRRGGLTAKGEVIYHLPKPSACPQTNPETATC